ncbi:hypothetical protein LCI18_007823 [Fusarium solani-melongenae]|uniref:Uncharacterized protein n=1 Tax=Fusarium solani subsp. cucurbitae TaxID=2747967 RepID=A0ACD3Z9Y3_FUSSC|nr:hypothetical protein LCI18_007823 [Fusarium solani-melongenae]
MAPDDLVFLRSKGALTIPDTDQQDALIWAYLEHVHPLLPLINVEDFIQSITEGNDTQSQASLLFFQAIMFAGSAYVELSVLKKAGFKSRKEALKAFYRRVRILYDFDIESDVLAVIPSLLLMTFWCGGADGNKNTWYWMDIAVSQVFRHSLNVDPELGKSTMAPSVLKLRRRIWWSCFIRDRLTSFGMKRTPRIRDEYFNVPMLEISDFRSEDSVGKNLARLQRVCSYFGNENRRTTLARLCIAQVSLCRCLRYTGAAPLPQQPDGFTMLSSIDPMLPLDDRSFAVCQRDLLEWYDTLCHGDKYQPILADDIHADGSANMELNRAVLHMVYHAGILDLHRSRIYNAGVTPCEMELSKTFVQHSAKRISKITSNIQDLGLDRFLPMTALSTTISAISVHLKEIRGEFVADILNANENYQRCLRVIESVKEIYCAADFVQVATEFSVLGLDQNDRSSNPVASWDFGQASAWDGTLGVSPVGEQFVVPDCIESGVAIPNPLGLLPFERFLEGLDGENVECV